MRLGAVRCAREDAHPRSPRNPRFESVTKGVVEREVHVAGTDALHHDPVHLFTNARAHEQVVHPLVTVRNCTFSLISATSK